MSLQHGILGFLNYGPCSGYELAKAFHSSVQFFWPAQTSQIYLTLGKLESVGLVTHETVIQTGKPNKNVYSILPAGREELLRWLSEQGRTTDGYKSEFLMKVFFAENLPPQQASPQTDHPPYSDRHARQRECAAAAQRRRQRGYSRNQAPARNCSDGA